jgi:hypothetical protein
MSRLRTICQNCSHSANWHQNGCCFGCFLYDVKPLCKLSARTVVKRFSPKENPVKTATMFAAAFLMLCLSILVPLTGRAGTVCVKDDALITCPAPAPVDPLARLGILLTTKSATPGASWAVVRSHGVDLSALVLTTQSDSNFRNRDVSTQRHFHGGFGVFVSVPHTNLSFGVLSVLNGSSFKRIQYAVSVRL